MSHTITWDHSQCEHTTDDDHWCSPRGRVSCDDPDGDCRKHCRTTGYTNCENGWNYCRDECDGYDHPNPGVPHCTEGHILDVDECNVMLFIEEDPVTNGPAEQQFTDGPIEAEWWTGYGFMWSYA